MDAVIEKISEIESASTSIMDNANERKKTFAREMTEKTAEFDDQLEKETQKEIEQLRADMEINMNNRLKQQQINAQKVFERMRKRFEDHHTQYVDDLFKTMIKE